MMKVRKGKDLPDSYLLGVGLLLSMYFMRYVGFFLFFLFFIFNFFF